MAEFTDMIKTFGWPGAFLIILGYVAWRISAFLKPYIISVFDNHVVFVQEAIKQTHNQTAVLEQMNSQQSAFLESMRGQHGDHIDLLKSMQSQHSETNGMIREIHMVIVGVDHRPTHDHA